MQVEKQDQEISRRGLPATYYKLLSDLIYFNLFHFVLNRIQFQPSS